MHKGNPEVIKFAHLIGRSPSSIALKLVNFANFDPTLRKRGIKGAENASKLDKAFDNGLITVSANDYSIVVSSRLKTKNNAQLVKDHFIAIEGKTINLPDKFLPAKEFLTIHNDFFKP